MTKNNFKISILAYFLISVVFHGLQRSCGLYVLILIQSFSTDRQNATMPFAVNWAVANIMASFSDILIVKKKSESAIIFGVLIAALGAGLCMLSTDTSALIICWGFIFGSGYGIASPHLSRFLQSVKSPKLQFFTQVTPSFGVLVMPFIIHSLASYYGLQSSYLIISGIILNYLPLSIAAAFNITFDLPNFNWRVRKKSRQYVVSKLEDKHISEESFVNSLEPELILQINQNDEFLDETYGSGIDNFVLSMNEILSVGRKRTETRGHDLQGLQEDLRISCMLPFGRKRTETRGYDLQGLEEIDPSFMSNARSLVDDAIQKNENENKHTKISFSYDITYAENDKSKPGSAQYNEACNNINKSENTVLDTTIMDVVDKTSESTNVNAVNNADSELGNGNNSELHTGNNKLAHSECEISQNLYADNKSDIILSEKEGQISTKDKSLHENTENSPLFDNKLKTSFEIKVHVEECTFINDGKQWYQNVSEVGIKNSHDDPLSSLMPKSQTDFTGQKFSTPFHKSSEQTKSKQLNIYCISEKIEPDNKQIANMKDTKQNVNVATTLKIKKILKFFNELTSPGCLCIILITIIFEINLLVFITMFADFGNDIDSEYCDLWILAAFGAGGVAGKFCCYKISRITSEKSNAIGVILFLLTGLSTAGLVFSTNLKWLAGFYCILGALESGISHTIPKFVSEYIDTNMLSTFTFVKRFLSGVAVISVPYAIGFSRDEMDDYDFLLQILSCSSILCAFVVYFLPYLSTSSDKKLSSSSNSKVEIA